jgi:hypothetical protein
MSRRWGKKYVDKRDWKSYNEKLVSRGCVLVDPVDLAGWMKDVERLNCGHYGRPFLFPDMLFYWAAMQHVVLGMPYRQIEGYLKSMLEGTGVKVPDYSTLYKRIKELEFDIEAMFKKKKKEACNSDR